MFPVYLGVSYSGLAFIQVSEIPRIITDLLHNPIHATTAPPSTILKIHFFHIIALPKLKIARNAIVVLTQAFCYHGLFQAISNRASSNRSPTLKISYFTKFLQFSTNDRLGGLLYLSCSILSLIRWSLWSHQACSSERR